jgi:hypothetical protein
MACQQLDAQSAGVGLETSQWEPPTGKHDFCCVLVYLLTNKAVTEQS